MAISKITYKSSPSATPETWMDATGATAAASDITSPKSAMLANGVVTAGTGSGGSGSQVFLTQYTLTGDTTISAFLAAAAYAVHSTSCIIIVRAKGAVAPSSGTYTVNNYWSIFQSGVRSEGRHYYKSGKLPPDSFGELLFNNEGDTVIEINNGVLSSSYSGTSCLGSTGDVVTIVEIDVDDDFLDILLTTQTA